MEEYIKCVLFDWGNTLMCEFPGFAGPMVAWPKVEAVPFADDILARLAPTHIIGLATNAVDSDEEEIRQALARVSLNHLIDRIYCSRKIGFLKPSQEFFEYIFRDLLLDPREIVMVGDDFERDVQGPTSQGVFSLWLNQHDNQRRIGRLHDTIYSLKDLPEALARREISLRERTSL